MNAEIADLADPLFADDADHGATLAIVAMVEGEVVYERYGTRPANVFQAAEAVTADTPLLSWSVAKSITHAAVGLAVADGLIDADAPAPVPSWRGTAKEEITLRQLLAMRSGLSFIEDYDDAGSSDCLAMLFGEGSGDMAAFAAGRDLLAEPGSVWNYSSGTTNIVARILGDALDRTGQEIGPYLRRRLFEPVGMASATIALDDAGTFVGSSYVHAPAREFARFGELYRRGGLAGEQRILDAEWVADAAIFSAADPENGLHYGHHWWLLPDHPGSIAAVGYEGQYIIVVPERRLTLVHFGKVPVETRPPLLARLDRIIRTCPVAGAGVE